MIYVEDSLQQSFKEIKRSDRLAVSGSDTLAITQVEVKAREREREVFFFLLRRKISDSDARG